MKIKRGSTGIIWPVFVADEYSPRYGGITGLDHTNITARYIRNPDSSSTGISVVTSTRGNWVSGGFVEINSMPGWYEFQVPDACWASGTSVAIQLVTATSGTSQGIPVNLFAEIDSVDYQDDAAFGLNDLRRSVGRGSVAASSTTTLLRTTGLDPSAAVANQFKGRVVIFDRTTTTAALRGQAAEITANDTSGNLTITALTTTPVAGNTFLIV